MHGQALQIRGSPSDVTSFVNDIVMNHVHKNMLLCSLSDT